MIKITMIAGQKAVDYYEENSKFPDDVEAGNLVDEISFRTQSELDAYKQGAADVFGQKAYKIIVRQDQMDCPCCEGWRKEFQGKKKAFCPNCGEQVLPVPAHAIQEL